MCILRLLDLPDLAAVRLTCQSYKRQSTPLVTSLKKQELQNRSLSTFLPRFPHICQLVTEVLSERNARQLATLQSVTIRKDYLGDSLAAFTALTRLTHLTLPMRFNGVRSKLNVAELTSLRSLSIHRIEIQFFKRCLAALPNLSSLSICSGEDCHLVALTACAHLTALHFGCIYAPITIARLRDLDLACLSVRADMRTEIISAINDLSSLRRLQEFHWQSPFSSSEASVASGFMMPAAPGPQLALNLPHLTCLMLNGPSGAVRSLVNGLTSMTGVHALGISVHHGEATSFGNLAEAFGLHAFRAVSAHPAQTLQAGSDLASMSRAPPEWDGQWAAHQGHACAPCVPCHNKYDYCRCAAPT